RRHAVSCVFPYTTLFRSVKPQVVKWWSPGALPIQMLADKEVNLAIAYSGRIQKIREEGVSVDLEWNHGTISSDFWVIPRGTKNRSEEHTSELQSRSDLVC